MFLINCRTLKLKFILTEDLPTHQYAILSHTWYRPASLEPTLAQFRQEDQAEARLTKGFWKIERLCQQALEDGLEWAWADTVCIDQLSSRELEQSLNSMFEWYEKAQVCYAYLEDISTTRFDDSVLESRWIERGWTLQELLAPDTLKFYNKEWQHLGDKEENVDALAQALQIDHGAFFGGFRPDSATGSGEYCVAERMSWAARRETTEPEDMAYCLLGIFNVRMRFDYGEGGVKAFKRLQHAIIAEYNDDSILAWGFGGWENLRDTNATLWESEDKQGWESGRFVPILAPSPRYFLHCTNVMRLERPKTRFDFVCDDLRVELPVFESIETGTWTALLSCGTKITDMRIAICLEPPHGSVGAKRILADSANGTSVVEDNKMFHVTAFPVPEGTTNISKRRNFVLSEDNINDHVAEGSECHEIWLDWGESDMLPKYDISHHIHNGYAHWSQSRNVLTIKEIPDLIAFEFNPRPGSGLIGFTILSAPPYRRALLCPGTGVSGGTYEQINNYLTQARVYSTLSLRASGGREVLVKAPVSQPAADWVIKTTFRVSFPHIQPRTS